MILPQDAAEVSPVAAPLAAPPLVAVVPAPQLPVVEWLQWAVMARLLLVAFLFTYNRNLSTEKLAHMAGTVCSLCPSTYRDLICIQCYYSDDTVQLSVPDRRVRLLDGLVVFCYGEYSLYCYRDPRVSSM